jgi:hypothetical protein
MRSVNAVADLGERRFGDVQEMQSVSRLAPGKSFHDIRRNRIRCASQLPAELVSFMCGKRLLNKLMKADEQIIRSLPCHEFVVVQRHVQRVI